MDAFTSFSEYIDYQARSIVRPIDMELTPDFTADCYEKCLSQTANLLAKIVPFYGDQPVKQAFLRQKIILCANCLNGYQKYFDAQQLNNLELLQNFAESNQSNVEKYLQEIEALTQQKVKEESDLLFKGIRESLDKISSTKVCPITLDSTSGCFIATAVYETPEHPDLDVFRDFRDNQLLTNSLGKWLVSIYYEIGPSLAKYIASQPKLKNFTHEKLKYLAQWMRK